MLECKKRLELESSKSADCAGVALGLDDVSVDAIGRIINVPWLRTSHTTLFQRINYSPFSIRVLVGMSPSSAGPASRFERRLLERTFAS
jgi:hypothetical protein